MTQTENEIAQILSATRNGSTRAPMVIEHRPVGWWQRRRDPEGAHHDDVQRGNSNLAIEAMTAAANAGAVARHVTSTYVETLKDVEASVNATSLESGLVKAYGARFVARVVNSTERTLADINDYAQEGQLARIKAPR